MALFILFLGVLFVPAILALDVNVTVHPTNLIVREGEPFVLSCNLSIGGDGLNSTLDVFYSWKKDGVLIANGSSVLSVVSANASHDGVYVCVVGVHGGGTEVMKSSQNITVIILTFGEDRAPLIAMIVSVSAVGTIITVSMILFGFYMCCKRSQSHSNLQNQCGHRAGNTNQRVPIPGRHSPSLPRHFLKGMRFKSSSLSHLQQSDFTLESSLSKSSADHLSGSQPTQVTDLEDPDFDFELDEDMFRQHPLSNSDDISSTSLTKTLASTKKTGGSRERKRRASDGMLVFPEATNIGTSLKSILKGSKSVNENLNHHSRSSAFSDTSSAMTQSDDNSLHLEKSVRFNVSREDWAEDSGVQTGSSTPHYSLLNRRSSEPEASGYHLNNGERRGSAPGDLQYKGFVEHINAERGDVSGDMDEGLATNSEEWSQQEREFNFEETQTGKRFEGIFSSAAETNKTEEREIQSTEQDVKLPSRIATRVAQFLSVSQKAAPSRGPSPLTTSSQKVAEMKERFLQKGEQPAGKNITSRDDGRRTSLSKLVQERAELFKSNSSISSGITLKRAHTSSEITTKVASPKSSSHSSSEILTGTGSPKKEACTSREIFTGIATLNENAPHDIANENSKSPTADEKGKSPTKKYRSSSTPSIPIPVFSAPSHLSNWVPACLRQTVISPNQSFRDESEQTSTHDSSNSDSEEDDELIMELPLKPTVGRDLLGTSGGTASMSPIGRSWLHSAKPFGSSLVSKPIMPVVGNMSPFNESIVSLHSGQRLGGIKRLSVIPEEPSSPCSSVTNVET